MAHRHGDPVRVTLAHKTGLPTSFTWRGHRYWVEVVAIWQLRERWWVQQAQQRHADRTYFRVMAADCQLFELHSDPVAGVWVLDIVHD